MNLLLDTNVVSKLLSDRFPTYRSNARRSVEMGDVHYTSAIVLFELEFGALKSPDPHRTRKRYRIAVEAMKDIIAFEPSDANIAARIRHDLTMRGESIGEYDVMIAAQALRTNSVMVTNNRKHFERIAGLAVVDWS